MLVKTFESQRREVIAFLALLAVMVAVAAGQLFVLAELDSTIFGLPVWVWVHLGILIVLLGLAWIATGLVSKGGEH